jgi:uncharacterized membrane protein
MLKRFLNMVTIFIVLFSVFLAFVPQNEARHEISYNRYGIPLLSIATGNGVAGPLNSDILSPIAQPLIKRESNDEAPHIAGNGTHLVVVWHGYVSENWDIWYTVYDGLSWGPPIRLTTDPHQDKWPYVTLLSNNRILVAWTSDRTGRGEIWYKVFINGGWTEDKKLDINIGDSNQFAAFTELNDGNIAVLWSSAHFGSNITDVWFARFTMELDGALKLVDGSERKLTAAYKDTWLFPTCILLTRYGRLYAFWNDLSKFNFKTNWGGVTTMYYGYSDDSGDSWSSGVLYSCNGCIAPYGIQLRNGTIVVFYQGDDLIHNVMDTIYYLRLNTSTGSWEGPFWLPSDVWHRWRPSAAYGPDGLYVVFTVPGKPWEDYYNDIYVIIPQKLEKSPEVLRFSPADDLQGSGISVDDRDSPTGKARYAATGAYLKEAIVFGPYITLRAGSYTARFLLKIDGATASRVATIDVCTELGKTVIASRDIWGREFREVGKYQWFTLNFVLNKTVPNIEFRVWYRPEGRTGLYVGLIEVLAAITAENITTKEATVVVEKTVTKTVTVTTGAMDSTTMTITVSLSVATFTLLVMLVSRRAVKGERFQQTISDELLRKAKLTELERLRTEGRISEEAYRRIREELES